ncbi:protein of unknown function [Xenorhabdus poinarii G6]|uniref:Uncharacterized protein n=1 Tax=Xenorhabdus poinarii G6 TaxID=1354304 RepID=A0A068R6V8_9GAMM|nr:protein of unknown function [Xenorhabdus poinarii G6]
MDWISFPVINGLANCNTVWVVVWLGRSGSPGNIMADIVDLFTM